MKIILALFVLYHLAFTLPTFAGESKTPSVKADRSAICPVCSHYKDGSCQEVKVEGKTPKAEHEGKTYYFCSPSCKKTFLRKPRKFVKAVPAS